MDNDHDYQNVMRTTRQRWWQFWKPLPNALERAIIAAHNAARTTCFHTGPDNGDPPMPRFERTEAPDFDK